jgi:hypothetical protein
LKRCWWRRRRWSTFMETFSHFFSFERIWLRAGLGLKPTIVGEIACVRCRWHCVYVKIEEGEG